jgi:hypothetical protein
VIVHRAMWQIEIDPEGEHPELVDMLVDAG